ncbi:MAG: glycosyltransferase family 1 protein [Cytophagia bacterium]|nr:glycosyltransferase family 1 protein [Cytophagia bacterium]MBT7994698.1 glycosyltransferase family 1 protein [Bacteroidota bacterium]
MSTKTSNLHLNIVSFDIPFPANYGGVIDVYYKMKALKEKGVKIHLHAFQYGRESCRELESICEEVSYYSRKRFGNLFNLKLPYIVKTRKSAQLLKNLQKNDFPILFEGLHCAYYANHDSLKHRNRMVRMHNIEYLYYMHLAKVEKNIFKQLYFKIEAIRLKNFQQILSNVNHIAAISPSDQIILNLKHQNSFYLPVFHPNDKLSSTIGKGEYILYHGNLGVGENNEAAIYLVENVFDKIEYPCIIAGSNPSRKLIDLVKDQSHIKLINPELDEIYDLIKNAQINILPTFQDTGIKLKLLNALYLGRYCLVNSKMVKDTGLDHLCIIASDDSEFVAQIHDYFNLDFTISQQETRQQHLQTLFSNNHNIDKLIDKI